MTTQQMEAKVIERAKELLTIPEVYNAYQSKESEEAAKDWILHQALITLLYTHEERMEMQKRKQAA